MGYILSHAYFKCDTTIHFIVNVYSLSASLHHLYLVALYMLECSRHTHVIIRLTLHAIVAHFNTRSGLFLTTLDLHVQVQEHGFRSRNVLSGDHRLPAQLVEPSPSILHQSSSPQLVSRPSSLCGPLIVFYSLLHCNSIHVLVM